VRGQCYLRGWSLLGLLNTLLGCVFAVVLIRHRDSTSHRTVRWSWGKASDWPPGEEGT